MVETNFQHYQHKIKEIILNGDCLALTNDGELRGCHGLSCGECQFFIHCHEKRKNWLNSEYKEPKLTPADHHLVNLLKNGWITRDYNGNLYWYSHKPNKVIHTWQIGKGSMFNLCASCFNNKFFSFITFEDSEPWSIEELLKLEVEK